MTRSLLLMLAFVLVSQANPAAAQSADFACPKPGTVAYSSKGNENKFTGANGPGYCQAVATMKDGATIPFRVYAPSVSLRESLPQDFATYLKVASLWPLQVGKKVQGHFMGVNQVGLRGAWDVTIVVETYGPVTVPAGTFDAFLVRQTQESGTYSGVWKYWYAPKVALSVKWEYSDNTGRKDGLEIVRLTQ